jgi:dephospho-CoA kinase
MKKIIIVNGYPKSGKTQFELYLTKHTSATIYSSITLVKEFAKKYFGWSGNENDKTEEWRRFFSELKRMFVVEFDYIFKDLSVQVNNFYRNTQAELLLIDSREPEEIERFKNQFQATTLFIKNDRVKKITSNDSDRNVESYKYDYIIENNGTLEELEQKAIEFIAKLN